MTSETGQTMLEPAPEQFECSVCCDDVEEVPKLIDNSPVCRECITTDIIPKFHEALKFEAQYPAEWGVGVELDPQDFSAYFEDFGSFIKAWEKKKPEYKMPVQDRLYCRDCGAFLRARSKAPQGSNIVYRPCPSCRKWCCGRCGTAHEQRAPKKKCNIDLADLAIDGMDDVKRCPNQTCSAIIELKDGCNHVVCSVCKTRFCFICRAANPPREHWNPGMPCPRFNKPGAANALYNDQVRDEDVIGEELTDEWGRALAAELLGGVDRWDPMFSADLADLEVLPLVPDREMSGVNNSPSAFVAARALQQLIDIQTRAVEENAQRTEEAPEWFISLEKTLNRVIDVITTLYTKRRSTMLEFSYHHRIHLLIIGRLDEVVREPEVHTRFPELRPVLIMYAIVAPVRLADALHTRGRFRRV
ncbi:hypothetical protein LTR37_009435 [Vermiconidia calcicola]|uniref:Uncharacterized protein n=1 Tax=Vermiconidia calcicola TaxID=1690605 RepID=A0ACC3N8A6_9PEZI|nr:hypothetical protein LTR37_009435 [Vermiconidia calcicola]